MTLKQGFIFFLRQVIWALLALSIVLLGMEYFLPASVLPFIDLMDVFLFLIFFAVLVLSTAISTGRAAWALQGFVGTAVCGVVLFIIWLQTDRFSLKALLLLACGAGCLISWLLTVLKPVVPTEAVPFPQQTPPPTPPIKPNV